MKTEPIEQRISHRVMLHASLRSGTLLNQYQIEDIVKEEISKTSELAAAPELLEALEVMLQAHIYPMGVLQTKANDKARAAIAKATGGAE